MSAKTAYYFMLVKYHITEFSEPFFTWSFWSIEREVMVLWENGRLSSVTKVMQIIQSKMVSV